MVVKGHLKICKRVVVFVASQIAADGGKDCKLEYGGKHIVFKNVASATRVGGLVHIDVREFCASIAADVVSAVYDGAVLRFVPPVDAGRPVRIWYTHRGVNYGAVYPRDFWHCVPMGEAGTASLVGDPVERIVGGGNDVSAVRLCTVLCGQVALPADYEMCGDDVVMGVRFMNAVLNRNVSDAYTTVAIFLGLFAFVVVQQYAEGVDTGTRLNHAWRFWLDHACVCLLNTVRAAPSHLMSLCAVLGLKQSTQPHLLLDGPRLETLHAGRAHSGTHLFFGNCI